MNHEWIGLFRLTDWAIGFWIWVKIDQHWGGRSIWAVMVCFNPLAAIPRQLR